MATYEGLSAIAQGYINNGVAANYFKREPKLWLLSHLAGEMGKGPKQLDIGRPSAANVFKGTGLTQAEHMSLSGYNSVKPRFAINNPTNVTILGAKDNAVQLPNITTNGNTQGDFFGEGRVNWTGLFSEEILIWEETLNRGLREAGASEGGRALARGRIVKDAIALGKQNIQTTLANELQHGNPTDQDADPMDHLIGWDVWFSATNYCAGVDRAVSKNAQWRAIVDSTAIAPSATAIIDSINIDHQLQDLSEDGVVALFVNGKQFKTMKAELLGLGWSMVIHSIPGMAQAGTTNKFVLQKDNCYVVYDRQVPANTCYGITPETWAFITHPDYTFAVSEFIPLWKYSRGAPRALRAEVNLRGMLVNWNPGLNVVYTAVQDPA